MPSCDRQRLGRYEVLAELGRGAMGTVYQARDPKIDRLVAIKTISVPGTQASGQPDFRERFFREARAAGRLSHPGIVTVYDVEEDPETGPYIVMEYVPGRTLDQLLSAENHRLSPATALDLTEQLARALHYAHSQCIIHRDVKPANIIVTEDGRAKIADFGIAKLDLTQFTATGQVFGTPSYMSPEQIEGEEVDARSDLFSLGVILYSMLTGYRPFQGNSAATISYKLVYKDPVPVTALNSALPVHLDYVVSRALAKSPAQRYRSGHEMALDLQDIEAGSAPRSQAGGAHAGAADQTRVQSALPKDTEWKSHILGRKNRRGIRRIYTLLHGKRAWLTVLGLVLMGSAAVSYRMYRRASTAPMASNTTATVSSPEELSPASQNASPPAATVPVGRVAAPKVPTPTVVKTAVPILVQSPFATATISIWVDDKMAYQHQLSGQTKKRMWVMKSAESDLSGIMSVPVGKHLLRVQIASERDHYLGVVRVDGNFDAHAHRTLSVSFHGHDHQMSAQLN